MEIRLSSWQTKVFDDSHRYLVINCGRRAGKSTLVSIKMTEFALTHKKVEVWYIAPTYKQAKQIMWQMLDEVVPQSAIEKKNETELTIYFKNKSKISLKGADTPDSLRGVKNRLVRI